VLANQWRYNIRVANNSFGSNLGDPDNYDPWHPINVGTRRMHDRYIAVIFAAGNSGDTPGAINRLAVAPWVISVAAGEKEGLGTPAGFSSRGWDNGSDREAAGHPADPEQAPNLRPDITGPGSNIKSARSKGPGLTNLLGTALLQDRDIPPAFLPFYTTSQGTSFSAPHVAGVAALMFEINPMLTPEQVMLILRATAMPMPFEERVVGAGYVDAHNAVRAAIGLAGVEPPADLIPGPDTPEIVDVRGDQLGTEAQDILTGRFQYDGVARELIYSLEVADLEQGFQNNRWTMSSVFGDTTIFVSASLNELGQEQYRYGRITLLDTGTRNQETLGEADWGEMDLDASRIRMGLDVDRINEAVGFDVVGTVSTATLANAQILIGTSLTGGLLLNADSASGRDFAVEDSGDGDNGDGNGDGSAPEPACDGPGIRERFAGVIDAGESETTVSFNQRCGSLKAQLTYNPGNASLALVLMDAQGNEQARAVQGNGRKLESSGLQPGEYRLRIEGSPEAAVDYVISTRQR
jgi:hypothetical protein